MAIFNEILSPRFQNAIKKLCSMKGGQGARQLSGEIMPVFPMFFGVENRWLEQWESFGATVFQAAVATFFSQVRLRNPSGSGVVAVIYKISIVESATDSPFLVTGPQAADLATGIVLSNNRWDARGRPQPTMSLSRTAAAALAANTWQGALLANVNLDVIVDDDQNIPLLPGDAITVACNTVNQGITVNLWWRERILEESERQ